MWGSAKESSLHSHWKPIVPTPATSQHNSHCVGIWQWSLIILSWLEPHLIIWRWWASTWRLWIWIWSLWVIWIQPTGSGSFVINGFYSYLETHGVLCSKPGRAVHANVLPNPSITKWVASLLHHSVEYHPCDHGSKAIR